MFSSNFLAQIFIAATVLASNVDAFFSTPSGNLSLRPRSSTISMMWDTKKVGKSVTQTTAPKVAEEEVFSKIFRRAPPGSGMDERSPSTLPVDLQDLESASISRIDRSLRQHSLLMTLEGTSLGTLDKVTRIQLGSLAEGTLPETLLGTSRVTTLAAGGLFKDWDTELF